MSTALTRRAAWALAGAGVVLGACESAGPARSPSPVAPDTSARVAAERNMTEVRAGGLPSWWVAEPRAIKGVVEVSASGTAGSLEVARDLAIRNARAAGRAVLGLEPVRIVVRQEAFARARTGEFEAFVLARCDAAGAAALPLGGERAGTPPAGGVAQPKAEAQAPGPAGVPAKGAGAKPATGEPEWWTEDVIHDGARVRACAKAEAPDLASARRAAIDAAHERLKGAGVTGAVQPLFISTTRLEGGGYRVYVMGQGGA